MKSMTTENGQIKIIFTTSHFFSFHFLQIVWGPSGTHKWPWRIRIQSF